MSLVPTNSMTPFAFKGREVRATTDGDTTWFVAKDVCEALKIPWRGNTLDSIKDDWKGMREFRTPGGIQSLTVISETAVYKLAFRSRKAEAERFTEWVAGEVLPAIKRTGSYQIEPARPESPATALDALEHIVSTLRLQESRFAALESDSQITKAKVEAITGGSGYFTVRGYANLNGVRIPTSVAAQIGRKAGKLAREGGFVMRQAIDELYGAVNSYPEEVLEQVFQELGL